MPNAVAESRTPRIAAIVLAAGRSRRFGAANKLLAPLHGEPLLWRTLDAVCQSRASPVIVVLGHQAARLHASLQAYRRSRGMPALRCVYNRRYRHGMASSLQRGLAALPANIDGAFICLGDMPGLRAGLLKRLRQAYHHGDDAVLPIVGTRRGNPVLLGRPLFDAVREQLHGDEGARRLLARATRMREVPGSAANLLDIDTRREWRRLSARR